MQVLFNKKHLKYCSDHQKVDPLIHHKTKVRFETRLLKMLNVIDHQYCYNSIYVIKYLKSSINLQIRESRHF
jgi:hypothetical protein